MPAISPEAISNRIRLANEVGAPVLAFVAERGAADSSLTFSGARVTAVVGESAPDEECAAVFGSKDDLFAGATEQGEAARRRFPRERIVSFVEREAVTVAVLCEPPEGGHADRRPP